MDSSTELSLTLKLLVDTKSNKVLFAEANKEFVDFLFNLLSFPVGFTMKLISAGGKHSSIGRLYDSVDGLGASYLQPNFCKSNLLHPKATSMDNGYVKETETYIVTDGLKVTPISAISTFALINRFVIRNKDVKLAEKVVGVSMDEVNLDRFVCIRGRN